MMKGYIKTNDGRIVKIFRANGRSAVTVFDSTGKELISLYGDCHLEVILVIDEFLKGNWNID